MKTVKRNYVIRFLAIFIAVFIACAMVWGSRSAAPVAYADSDYLEMDSTDVMDDLSGITVNGQPFDAADYGADKSKDVQVLTFVEYSYSYYGNLRGNYALYVYVWNPQKTNYVTLSRLNAVSLRFGGDDTSGYEKYPLLFLDGSDDGLFYKFRVTLTADDKTAIFAALDSSKRVYEISEIELLESGETNPTAYAVAAKYTYTGYAAGFGEQTGAASTLGCIVEDSVVIETEVHSTVYRPEGSNGKNDYTQDSLHSVYFSIPRDIVEEYGNMTAVHATWLDATLAPVLVTGNKEAYDAILPYLGQVIGTHIDDLEHAYVGGANYTVTSWSGSTAIYGWESVYSFNLPGAWSGLDGGISNKSSREVSPLYLLAYTGDDAASADDYVLSREDIKSMLEEYTLRYGGDLVNDRYSRVLFDDVADSFTEMNIQADTEYSLTNEVLGSSRWDELWGITYPSTFDGIKAIYEVTDSDFKSDEKSTCDGLFIAEQDYDEFKKFYDLTKAENVVYLFRYQVTDYISTEAEHFVPETGLGAMGGAWSSDDSNAYFMQETVNIGFDIIDVTCTMNGVPTIIGVASDPIDVIGHGTPPIETTPDEDFDFWEWLRELISSNDWLKWVIAIVALIVLLPILVYLLPVVIKFVVWVISLPFKLIKAIGKLFKKKE